MLLNSNHVRLTLRTTVVRITLIWVLVLLVIPIFSQVNYDAGRNLKDWTTTGEYLVDSHEWFGDTLVVASTFRYVFDTIERVQGDSTITVVRYGSALGIHVYPDEYSPATVNIVDSAYIPVTTPVLYKGKMYWGAQKSFTPPDTSAWIVLYEFDPRTLERRTMTLHDADSDFHYMYDLEVRGNLLSAITRAGISGDGQYYLNVIDPAQWILVSQAPLEWTTGRPSPSPKRLHTSDIQFFPNDTVVLVLGEENTFDSNNEIFLKFYNLKGEELSTNYLGDQFYSGVWLDYTERRNYDRSILTLRSDSNAFFLTNHGHIDWQEDSTTASDLKAISFNSGSFEKIDSSDTGSSNFVDGMQALMDFTTIGDTLVSVGQCGITYEEDDINSPNYLKTLNQLGILAYDMNTLQLLWTKRIIAETEYRELSDDYGVSSSPHNFVSATAMTWHRNEIDGTLDNEVRIIHLNEHGCPSGDPDKTCDELIWLDQYVSDTDDPRSSGGIVPSIQVVPSLLAVGADNRIQFTAEAIPTFSSNGYTVELYDSNARRLDNATLLDLSAPYTLPSSLTSGVYYAYLRSSTGASIGVGKFVVQ